MELQSETILGIDINILIALGIMIPVLMFAFFIAWLDYRKIRKLLIYFSHALDFRSISSNVASGIYTQDGTSIPFRYSYAIGNGATGSALNVYLDTQITNSFSIEHRKTYRTFDNTFTKRKESSLNITYLKQKFRIFSKDDDFLFRFLNDEEVQNSIQSLVNLGFSFIECDKEINVSRRSFMTDKDLKDDLILETLGLLFRLDLAAKKYTD